jgi:predicted DNA-binding transcriptional regulator AlpA
VKKKVSKTRGASGDLFYFGHPHALREGGRKVVTRKKTGQQPGSTFPKLSKPVPIAEPVEVSGPVKLLSKKEVLAIVGVCNVTLRSWIMAGRFPAPRVLGPPDGGHRSRMGWIDTEVYAAIANAPRRMPKGSEVTP